MTDMNPGINPGQRTRSNFPASVKATVMHALASAALSVSLSAQAANEPGSDADLPFHTTFDVKVSPSLAQTLPPEVRKAGYIIIGTNPNTPPTTYLADDNRTLEGREIDIMSAVAQRLGLTPRWRNVGGFDNIIPGLSSGRYQAALANINGNAERNKHVDFVSYFNSNRYGLIARNVPGEQAPAPLSDLDQLCGQTIGAGSGTGNLTTLQAQSGKCTAQGKAGIEIPVFPSRPAGVQSVASGRTPSFLGPYEGITYTVTASKDTLRLAGVFTSSTHQISIALQKDSALTQPVKAAVNSLIQDGTYQKILDKWGLAYGAIPESLANAEIPREE